MCSASPVMFRIVIYLLKKNKTKKNWRLDRAGLRVWGGVVKAWEGVVSDHGPGGLQLGGNPN